MYRPEIGISDHTLSLILKVVQENPKVSEVILFGSRAKGNFVSGSDIDLALKGNEINLNDILELSVNLDKLNLPYKFDLIIYDRIQESALIEHITRNGICLFRK
ncbi:MAG TPA: nucleotidyltransferase domain-containing protein [Bacteroidales bacterium]|nr:nucleotidyltransferase domain-containing protein [Bacteroidales bacterium]